MKKKRTFAFHSMLDPHCFGVRIHEEAGKANLLIEQSENAFNLRIDGNHGGQVFYQAHMSADENGGCLIEGEIITIPWNEVKNRTKFQKVMEVIGYILGGIVLSPVIVLIFLFLGLYELFLLFKNKGKRELPREEKNLLDFMINKMCCKQK
ncbi:MAG: hypothetical protein J6V80_07140 [Clostridia bacterium]|nr:hypothetical protein [Clostridia bacterium]